LLIDADLHKPSIQGTMNLQATSGLSTVIRAVGEASKADPGSAPAEDVIVTVPDVPNLSVLTAGPPDPAPSELLGSERMRVLLAEWAKKYDHVVIDTAPVLLAADVVPLSVEADSVILVVRCGYTPREAFSRAQALLKLVNAPVTGVVLNGYALNSPEFSHYGKYGYGYGYGAGESKAKTNQPI
jgi:polysaccharide biosynthesis transport protein